MIIALHREGLSQREISKRMCCSQSSVHYIIQKERECGSVRDKKIPGRKRNTTSREDRALVKLSLSNRSTAPALRASLHTSFNINLSNSTIKKGCVKLGSMVVSLVTSHCSLPITRSVAYITPKNSCHGPVKCGPRCYGVMSPDFAFIRVMVGCMFAAELAKNILMRVWYRK